MEGTPQDQEQYDSTRDQALHLLCSEGWANSSAGDPDAPHGVFYWISNNKAELIEVQDALDAIDPQLIYTPKTLLGHFIVTEQREGTVRVEDYPSMSHAVREFGERVKSYQMLGRIAI